MMNDLEKLALLAARARREAVPHVDVSACVLARLRRGDEPSLPGWPLLAVSGLSAVAASIVLFVAVQGWFALGDPLASLLSPLTMVML